MIKYCAMDTETGGIDPDKQSLLTVCFRFMDEKFNDLFKYHFGLKHDTYQVTPGALLVNNINLIEHDKSALNLAEIKELISPALSECSDVTVVGHNVHFDVGFIRKQLPVADWGKVFSHRLRDTQAIGQWMIDVGLLPVDKPSLSKMCEHFNIVYNAHDAMADTDATVELYLKLRQMGLDLVGRGHD